MIKKIVFWILKIFCIPLFCLFVFLISIYVRLSKKQNKNIVLGSTPIINYKYWSQALKLAGYSAETFTTDYYKSINKRADWDRILSEEYSSLPNIAKPYIAFIQSILNYDVFIISFDGYFLSSTPIWFLEPFFLKLSKKRIIICAYGADSYIYNRIQSSSLLFGLLKSYPEAGKRQKFLSRRLDLWCSYSDIVAPGVMLMDGIGRCDVPVASTLCLDFKEWKKSLKQSSANGVNGTVIIAHAPNHRGFKGSEFIIDAVKKLKESGLLVELILIEKKQNEEVKRILTEEADILVEQLIFTGHGLNGLEGMMSGLPVVSNLEDQSYLLPFKRWSYFSECPLVSASPETIKDVLERLVRTPELRHSLGEASRDYAVKFHSLEASSFLFGKMIESLYDPRIDLINLYHPFTGVYPGSEKKIQPIVVKNRLGSDGP